VPFAYDTQSNLVMAVALVNTGLRRDGSDALATVDDLNRFCREHGLAGRHDGDAAELAQVHQVRERLTELWSVDRDRAADLVNAMLAESAAIPRLVRHDGWDWHLHATALTAPLPVRVIVESAMAVVDVIRSDEWARMARCAAEECDAVLIDLSRNRSRRFCDVNSCANRAHVAAYRARRAADENEDDARPQP
jgi:predicted RNA-binding Zn ribbon-like protein